MSVVVLGDQLSVSDLNCGRAGGNIDYLGDDAWGCRWVICPWVVCNWEFADNLISCAGRFYSSLILLFNIFSFRYKMVTQHTSWTGFTSFYS